MLAEIAIDVGPVLGGLAYAALPSLLAWLAYRKAHAANEAAAIAAKAVLAAAAGDAKKVLELEAVARRKLG